LEEKRERWRGREPWGFNVGLATTCLDGFTCLKYLGEPTLTHTHTHTHTLSLSHAHTHTRVEREKMYTHKFNVRKIHSQRQTQKDIQTQRDTVRDLEADIE
jgi:hypothetical protein